MYHIMTLQVKSRDPRIRQAAASLASSLLSRSIIFDHDPSETDLWLQALPRSMRASDAKAPDGTPLLDESEAVISFLDECILRCLKTPYHYLEGILDICYGSSSTLVSSQTSPVEQQHRSPHLAPSPLLATLLEQFAFKQNKQLFEASDHLAVVTYLRELVIGFIGKQPDPGSSLRLLEKLCALVEESKLGSTAISTALSRELRLIRNLADCLRGSRAGSAKGSRNKEAREAVAKFLEGMEAISPGVLFTSPGR